MAYQRSALTIRCRCDHARPTTRQTMGRAVGPLRHRSAPRLVAAMKAAPGRRTRSLLRPDPSDPQRAADRASYVCGGRYRRGGQTVRPPAQCGRWPRQRGRSASRNVQKQGSAFDSTVAPVHTTAQGGSTCKLWAITKPYLTVAEQ